MIKDLLKQWGFDNDVTIVSNPTEYAYEREDHIWTINKNYILRASKNESAMFNHILISKLLSNANIPTQKCIDTLYGQSYIKQDEIYYSLFKKIHGKVFNNYFDSDYLTRGRILGKSLAELHLGLKGITEEVQNKLNIYDNDLPKELSSWVSEELNKYITKSTLSKDELKEFEETITEVKNEFPKLYKNLPRQLIHRDFQIENIIFNNGEIAGYIDFDLTQINARLFDICYLLTGSLSTIFNKKEMKNKWIQFSEEVIKGYESISTLTIDEHNSMKYMMCSIEMIMVAFFFQNGCIEIADCNVRMINYLQNEYFKIQK